MDVHNDVWEASNFVQDKQLEELKTDEDVYNDKYVIMSTLVNFINTLQAS